MPYSQEDLKKFYADIPEGLVVYPPNRGAANVDDVVLLGADRKAPDGTVQRELSIGIVLYDRTAVAIPVINVLKFALQQHPELLERAKAELQAATPA